MRPCVNPHCTHAIEVKWKNGHFYCAVGFFSLLSYICIQNRFVSRKKITSSSSSPLTSILRRRAHTYSHTLTCIMPLSIFIFFSASSVLSLSSLGAFSLLAYSIFYFYVSLILRTTLNGNFFLFNQLFHFGNRTGNVYLYFMSFCMHFKPESLVSERECTKHETFSVSGQRTAYLYITVVCMAWMGPSVLLDCYLHSLLRYDNNACATRWSKHSVPFTAKYFQSNLGTWARTQSINRKQQ